MERERDRETRGQRVGESERETERQRDRQRMKISWYKLLECAKGQFKKLLIKYIKYFYNKKIEIMLFEIFLNQIALNEEYNENDV